MVSNNKNKANDSNLEEELPIVVAIDSDEEVEDTFDVEAFFEDCEEFQDEELFKETDYYVPKASVLSKEDKNILAEENMRLIQYVVKRFLNTGIDYSELLSVALMGYTKAINNFNPLKPSKTGNPIKFSTFAYRCITNEIFYYIRSEKKIRERTIPLQTPLSTDKNGNSLELDSIISTEQNGEMSLEDKVEADETISILQKIVEEYLDEKEKLIIKHRYGICGVVPMTQNELAEKIGMSQANISKLEKNILAKIRRIMVSKFKIKEF